MSAGTPFSQRLLPHEGGWNHTDNAASYLSAVQEAQSRTGVQRNSFAELTLLLSPGKARGAAAPPHCVEFV